VTVTIRDFEEPDWPRVLRIVRRVVDDGDTYAYDAAWDDERLRAVWVEPPPAHTVVAVDGDEVLGTAKFGPNRPGRGSHVATASFMVAPEGRGRGVGRALGEHVLAAARADGYAAMQFNAVVEVNRPAVHLWRSLGFEVVGTVPEAFDHPTAGLVGLHVMHRRL
jgi:ribosomal protein S18 acetylase RimI-like enzyme